MDYLSLRGKLDKFPHIQEKLNLLWGTEFCRPYIFELIYPVRNGRQGFPFDVLLAIQNLLILHDQSFPQFADPGPTFGLPRRF